MEHSIMTERLARRGAPVRTEYAADFLQQILTRDCASGEVVTLPAEQTLRATREWLDARRAGADHQGYPIVRADGTLAGVLTRRDFEREGADLDRTLGSLVHRAPVIVFDDNTAREAADHMVHAHVGRLPVVTRAAPDRVVGIITRSDLLEAHERRLTGLTRAERSLDLVPAGWERASRWMQRRARRAPADGPSDKLS
jgi:CBS domain-containing protein